jgi:hypothetical protein
MMDGPPLRFPNPSNVNVALFNTNGLGNPSYNFAKIIRKRQIFKDIFLQPNNWLHSPSLRLRA